MDWGRVSTDVLEQRLLANAESRARLDAADIETLEELDRRQTATADGCRNLSEWLAARTDVGVETAQRLVRTMRRTVDRPDLREALAEGVSLDRVEAVSKIPTDVGLLEHLDVGGVRREAARRAELTATDEHRTAQEQFLVLQPSLDESWWRLWGGLDGHSGAIVDKALSEKADQLPDLPDGTKGPGAWRKAVALLDICSTDDPPPAQVTVFVDADEAVPSNGRAGVTIETGPRIGARALEAVLCDAVTEVTVNTTDGRLLEYGRRSRTVPPALRRAIIHRDGGVCAADGCNSRHRLQIHHKTPWSQEGTTDPDNLVTLCWFHHQIVIHQWGYRIYHHPDHGRIRFRKPTRAPPARR